ncbi:general secretion pathway protein K [Duganella sp. 1411]|uniref:type II secretion system minor pseudopilin GspK n=1 Tax=Duganella sp. 1411 TaxID=2806572 RepID=UPI001AE99139|nr:general secretion pathway protein K [Duganella sp. 1411]
MTRPGRKPGRQPRRRQRGVAVITALLLTTLAVTIVASLFWQQQVQVRSMENQRLQLQTRWIVRGALDLSRLILFQDFLDSQLYTRLNGIWSTPLEETRLDDYVERERQEGEDFNATLSGKIVDAQSRYNLTNLATGRVPDKAQIGVLQRLLTNLQLDTNLAQQVAMQVAMTQPVQQPGVAPGTGTGTGSGTGATTGTGGTGSGTGTGTGTGTGAPPGAVPAAGSVEPMGFIRVEDLLAVSGFTPRAIERLREFIIVLPQPTKVNVNTAPAELIAALVPGLSLGDAAAMVNTRKGAFYRQMADFTQQPQMGAAQRQTAVPVDVRSDYFLAFSQVKLDRAALDTVSLLSRAPTGLTTVVWIREN